MDMEILDTIIFEDGMPSEEESEERCLFFLDGTPDTANK